VVAALGERDYRVTSAALGADGVRVAVDVRPDLLVLKLVLLNTPGAEVLRRVRALDGLALVPAVFVSSERYDPAHPESSAAVVLRPFLDDRARHRARLRPRAG
jgi:DNA-binding response OmpR family regulator